MTGVRVATGARARGRGYEVAKRVLDVTAAGILLLFSAPVLVLACAAVRLTSAGPALFRQERVGLGGATFTMYKLRTMRADADADAGRHVAYVRTLMRDPGRAGDADRGFKLADDDRITAVGGLLRRTSLDELPQLVNVIRGEMSLVGPRPAMAYEVALYDEAHRPRLTVRPGLTGLWQVSGRNRLTMRQMLDLDVRYVRERSIRLDLAILARTPGEVLRPSGAR